MLIRNSIFSTFETCPTKYKHRYINKMVVRKTPTYFVVGSAVHKFREIFYKMRGTNIDMALNAMRDIFNSVDKGLMDPEELREYQIDVAMTEAICRSYAKIYAKDFVRYKNFLCEQVFDKNGLDLGINPITKEVIKYGGTIDVLVQDNNNDWWVLETKTSSGFNQSYLRRVAIDSQVIGYYILAEKLLGIKPVGVIYDVIKKSLLRQKATESLTEYIERVELDYSQNWEAKQLFLRYPIHLSEGRTDMWIKEKKRTLKTMFGMQKDNIYPKHTSACLGMFGQACEYLDACISGDYKQILYEKEKN